MSLRWQDVGERSHAHYGNRELASGEYFRSLCGRWWEVWPEDVRTRHDWKFWVGLGWLDHAMRLPCRECERIEQAMRDLGKQTAA